MPNQVEYEERDDLAAEEEEPTLPGVGTPANFVGDGGAEDVAPVQEPEPEEAEEPDDDGPSVWDSRTADPDLELFDGGPTVKQLNKWKDEYGENRIFVMSVTPTDHVVWRTLRRGEYRKLMERFENMVSQGISEGVANIQQEEMIARLCTLYPHSNQLEEENVLAGIAASVSSAVMEASGFSILDVRQL